MYANGWYAREMGGISSGGAWGGGWLDDVRRIVQRVRDSWDMIGFMCVYLVMLLHALGLTQVYLNE